MYNIVIAGRKSGTTARLKINYAHSGWDLRTLNISISQSDIRYKVSPSRGMVMQGFLIPLPPIQTDGPHRVLPPPKHDPYSINQLKTEKNDCVLLSYAIWQPNKQLWPITGRPCYSPNKIQSIFINF